MTREIKFDYEKDLYKPGHRACPGCGSALACKYVTDAAGPNTIISMPTGCMEVTSTPYPESAWGVSWIHNLFENVAAVAAGIETAYKAFKKKEKEGYVDYDDLNVIALAGDGATFDIGIRGLSGMMERAHNVLYICYDNEAYMNTGVQRSGSTPFGANTTTSPAGRESFGEDLMKKDMPAIAVNHKCSYVATACVSYPRDFKRKIKKALETYGPKYIQALAPCPVGWDYESDKTIEVGKLAVQAGLYPLFEIENGNVTSVKRVKRKPVEEYLRVQGRFSHLFKKEGGDEIIKKIQEIAEAKAERYGFDVQET